MREHGVAPMIDGGSVSQALVEYRGPAKMSELVTGVKSGRTYRFDGREHRRQYVLSEDLEWLLMHPELKLVAGSTVDPRERAWGREVDRLRAELREELAVTVGVAADQPAPPRRGGRRPTPPERIELAVHLRSHDEVKEVTYAQVARRLSSPGWDHSPGAIEKWFERNPEVVASEVCRYCSGEREISRARD